MSARQVAVLVPAAVEDLHDAHAALDQAPGQQALAANGAGLRHVRAVHLERRPSSPSTESVSSGTLRLHAERHLVLGDAGLGFGIAEALEVALVELAERVEHRCGGRRGVDAVGFWSRAPDRRRPRSATPVYLPGRKPAAPHAREERLARWPWTSRAGVSTTKAGRSLLSLPRP